MLKNYVYRQWLAEHKELDLLQQHWQRTRTGTGQSVLIIGEAGIGKSRLALEFRNSIHEQDHSWLECRCAYENRNKALRPLTALAERILKASGEVSLASLEALLGQYDLDLAETVPLFADLLSIPLSDRYKAPQGHL